MKQRKKIKKKKSNGERKKDSKTETNQERNI